MPSMKSRDCCGDGRGGCAYRSSGQKISELSHDCPSSWGIPHSKLSQWKGGGVLECRKALGQDRSVGMNKGDLTSHIPIRITNLTSKEGRRYVRYRQEYLA